MIYMNKNIFEILNFINEGVVITDEDLNILFWNKSMESITGVNREKAIGVDVYTIIPNLNKNYFRESIQSVIDEDYKFFYSAAMHKNLIAGDIQVNMRLSRLENENLKYLLIECIDVTNQIIRIDQLKQYNKELTILNQKLKEKEKEIEKLAYYDSLTGLANRSLFYSMAEKFLEDSKRNSKKMGLMFIDVDKFKSINDTYGHKVGDEVLKEVARILEKSVRKYDIVARHGGDEFLILLPDIKEYDNYEDIASRIASANKEVEIDYSIRIKLSLSMGISFYPRDGSNIDQLMSNADKAMYFSKNAGGNKCSYYTLITEEI